MRKNIVKRMFSLLAGLAVAVSAMAVPAFADGPQYVVTFRPGEHGVFTQADADAYVGKDGVVDVQLTANGAIAVLVEEGALMPTLPAAVSMEADSRYYVYDMAPGYAAATAVDRDTDFVTSYAIGAEGAKYAYTVRYIDVDAPDVDVAPAMQGVAGGPQIRLHSVAVDYYELVEQADCGYTVEDESATMEVTLTEDGENVFYFYYKYDPTYVPGDKIVQNVVVGGGTGEGETGTGGEVINPDDVPEGPGSGASSQPGEEIDDPDTPLGPGDEEPTGGLGTVGTVAAVGCGLGLLALLILWLKRKKKEEPAE